MLRHTDYVTDQSDVKQVEDITILCEVVPPDQRTRPEPQIWCPHQTSMFVFIISSPLCRQTSQISSL